jgi:toxin ParE1/3/4
LTTIPWKIYLGIEAEKDFVSILKYTKDNFGLPQASIYKEMILKTLAALDDGSYIIGSKSCEEILPNLRSLHVSRKGNRGRHIVFYRETKNNIIEVIRILHDAMDLESNIISYNA